MRWHADLQEYDFQLEYIPGKTNITANALSRPPGVNKGEEDNRNIIVILEHQINTITVPNVQEVKRAIMVEMHDHPTAGHPGRDETLRCTKAKYSWPGIKEWIADYVKGCATC